MKSFLIDASALVKRFLPEPGAPLVHALLDSVEHSRLVCATSSVAETFSIIIRAQNDGRLTADMGERAIRLFYWEVLFGALRTMHPGEHLLSGALELVERHNINSTDAFLLRAGLDLQAGLQVSGDGLVLVASDARLLRAARNEGFSLFDPETDSEAALRSLL